jgi:hypothetical protein
LKEKARKAMIYVNGVLRAVYCLISIHCEISTFAVQEFCAKIAEINAYLHINIAQISFERWSKSGGPEDSVLFPGLGLAITAVLFYVWFYADLLNVLRRDCNVSRCL